MIQKPTIGIVLASTAEDHDFEPLPAYRFEYLKQHYYEIVEAQGGLPLAIPSSERIDHIPLYLSKIDGLLLVGGEDIHPRFYHEEVTHSRIKVPPRRDQWEKAILLEAHESRMPILGLCRGLQIMNVAFGGTLYQDLPAEARTSIHSQMGELDFSTSHQTRIVSGTRFHQIVGGDEIVTNTAHHQGIRKLGRGLTVAAYAEDKVIEAIEGRDYTIAVQWHPEAWPLDPVSQKLFASFCRAAEEFGSVRPI